MAKSIQHIDVGYTISGEIVVLLREATGDPQPILLSPAVCARLIAVLQDALTQVHPPAPVQDGIGVQDTVRVRLAPPKE